MLLTNIVKFDRRSFLTSISLTNGTERNNNNEQIKNIVKSGKSEFSSKFVKKDKLNILFRILTIF